VLRSGSWSEWDWESDRDSGSGPADSPSAVETKRVGDGYEVVLRPKGVGSGDARRHDALPSGRPDLTKAKVETESPGGGEEGQSPTGQVVLAQVIRDKTAADRPGVWTEKARAVVGEKWAHLLDQYA